MEIARHWRLKGPRYRLEGSTCPHCGQPSFPPRPVCPDCAAAPAPSAGWTLAELPAAMAEFEPQLRYPILERVME
jgi:hypothetical protein